MLHRLLGRASDIEGELVVLVVELGLLALHPTIQLFSGELVAQELIGLPGLFDLLFEVLVIEVRDLFSD